MSRISCIVKLVSRIHQLTRERALSQSSSFSTTRKQTREGLADLTKDMPVNDPASQIQIQNSPTISRRRQTIGENVSRRDKNAFLGTTLMDLPNNKEAVYSTLDAWVAWERDFPIGPLKQVLFRLEKEQQWHRIIQVIKWMLSKGQGTTRGTYGQLIRALDQDHRVEEAHEIWKKKLGYDLHSVPWKLCDLMISVYYRNDMLDDLVKLFKGLEAFDRKPPGKAVVQKVANAYEQLGLPQEKERILEKYKNLFEEKPKKIRGSCSCSLKKDERETKAESASDSPC